MEGSGRPYHTEASVGHIRRLLNIMQQLNDSFMRKWQRAIEPGISSLNGKGNSHFTTAKYINTRHKPEASCDKYASSAMEEASRILFRPEQEQRPAFTGRHQKSPQSDLANFSIASRRIST